MTSIFATYSKSSALVRDDRPQVVKIHLRYNLSRSFAVLESLMSECEHGCPHRGREKTLPEFYKELKMKTG